MDPSCSGCRESEESEVWRQQHRFVGWKQSVSLLQEDKGILGIRVKETASSKSAYDLGLTL